MQLASRIVVQSTSASMCSLCQMVSCSLDLSNYEYSARLGQNIHNWRNELFLRRHFGYRPASYRTFLCVTDLDRISMTVIKLVQGN